MNEKNILDIKNLEVIFKTNSGVYNAVNNISFSLFENEILGIVGESGSGKSVTCYSVNRTLPIPPGEIKGQIFYNNVDLLTLPESEMTKYRGKEISMIFQEPMTALNPVFSIKMQMNEVLMQHEGLNSKEALSKSISMLESVGINNAAKRIHEYPHNFSGGMRQRVLIAMALLCNPKILIADEPTTALDVTIQAQILKLLLDIKNERRNMSMIFVTHNLALISQICNRIIVMYGGQIQEQAFVKDFFENPFHPYSKGLLQCLPCYYKKGEPLNPIQGNVPETDNLPDGCKFWPRCKFKMKVCENTEPLLKKIKENHYVKCHLF